MGLNVAEAIAYLKKVESALNQGDLSEADRPLVIESLNLLRPKSDYQMFGVLAETYEQAIAAITDYAKAFEYDIPESPERLDGPIYLKYNPATKLCYCDGYKGTHRGVLVSFQSDYEDGVNEMFGHFPLDLYRESYDF
jgi:hypothetical protein